MNLPYDPPQVVIGVLTWRDYESTRRCLESLRRLVGWPIQTAIVDSNSGTGEGDRLASEFGPPVCAITLEENAGVAGGYNAAIAWAAQLGAQHVLLLNNDTIVDDELLVKKLLAAMGERVAVAGPSTKEGDGTLFSVGGKFDWNRGVGTVLKSPPISGIYDVEWLDGCCLLVSVEVARRVGGLAPQYFMYWEELDWCTRARRAGFRCVVDPDASIRHARSTRDPSMQVRYWMLRNAILFMRRQASLRQNVTSLLWAMLYRSPGMVIRRLDKPQSAFQMTRAIVSALAWNLRDALRQRRWRIPPDGPAIDE